MAQLLRVTSVLSGCPDLAPSICNFSSRGSDTSGFHRHLHTCPQTDRQTDRRTHAHTHMQKKLNILNFLKTVTCMNVFHAFMSAYHVHA